MLDGAFEPDKKNVNVIFVDETEINVGGTEALIWIAFDPTVKAILGFHLSSSGNSVDAYRFIMKLVKKYGRKPIYTDGAMWYTGACKWAGVEHIVFDFNEKGLIERINEYVKDRTEAFDDLFPCRSSFSNCLDHVGNWMAIYSFSIITHFQQTTLQ